MSSPYAQPSVPADDEAAERNFPAPVRLPTVLESVLDADALSLQMMDENRRLGTMHSLVTEPPKDAEQVTLDRALHLILYHRPYPEEMRRTDARAARKFFDRWNRLLGTHPLSSRSPRKILQKDCHTALSAAGLDNGIVKLRFEHVKFSEKADFTDIERDFIALACVSTKQEEASYKSLIETNSDVAYWQTSIGWRERDKRIYLAGVSLHEVTHIDQLKQMLAEPLSENLPDTEEPHQIMNFEQSVLKDRLGKKVIYRCTLLERQAYYRQALFTEMAGGHVPRTSERFHMDAALESKFLAAASNHLLSQLPALLAKPQPA